MHFTCDGLFGCPAQGFVLLPLLPLVPPLLLLGVPLKHAFAAATSHPALSRQAYWVAETVAHVDAQWLASELHCFARATHCAAQSAGGPLVAPAPAPPLAPLEVEPLSVLLLHPTTTTAITPPTHPKRARATNPPSEPTVDLDMTDLLMESG